MRHLFFAATLAAALPFHGLQSQFEKIAPVAEGRVGVAAQLIESGETADLHGEEHFPTHSVYKLPISMAVLQRVDRGELEARSASEGRAKRSRAKGNVIAGAR
jgi:beta-lactamase class A